MCRTITGVGPNLDDRLRIGANSKVFGSSESSWYGMSSSEELARQIVSKSCTISSEIEGRKRCLSHLQYQTTNANINEFNSMLDG